MSFFLEMIYLKIVLVCILYMHLLNSEHTREHIHGVCAHAENLRKTHTIRIQDDYPYTSFIEKRLYWGNPNDENTKTRLIRMRTQKST